MGPTTMKLVHPSSTENASKFAVLFQIFISFTSCIGYYFFNLSIIYFRLLFSLFFLYLFSHIIIFQRIEKFEQCTEIERDVLRRGRCRKLVGKQQHLCLLPY